ncbi:hypothetical protein LJC10_01895 [Selenomonadales bacterium OttesenSCG-928-I06]|nr:hypothetical protein [Selenomonadales bacterium OttesenSCG-928-I06]
MYYVYTAQPDFFNPPCIYALLMRFCVCSQIWFMLFLELRQEIGVVI